MRVLAVQAREPVRGDRMVEKDWPWPNLSDEALWRLKPGDQSSLPWPQTPGQHWRAHPRAEIDQRHNIVQIMAVIVLVGPRYQQMFAGDMRRGREPFKMEPAFYRTVRQRPLDDRLDRRQVPLPKGAKERMAPDSTLWRDEQAERRKPILIDEMLERDRWRIDGVIDVMDALGVRRVDAERMHPGGVLGTRDDLALRERGRQASLIGDDCQICRFVKSDWNSLAGHRQRIAQTAPQIPPRRADGVAPGCMQRSTEANQLFVFDQVARHAAPLAV